MTGHTVRAAKLHPEGNKVRVTWTDLEGPRTKVGDRVILSRMRPYQYAFKHPLLVCEGEGGGLKLDATKHAPEDAAEGEWQVDRHVNANNYYGM